MGGLYEIDDTNRDAGKLWLAPDVVNHFTNGSCSGVHREMQGLLGHHYQRIVPRPGIAEKIKYDDVSEETFRNLKAVTEEILISEKDKIDEIAKTLLKIKTFRPSSTNS